MNDDDYGQNIDPLWDKCIKAADAGNNVEAVFNLKLLAEKGHWQALAQIGAYYEAGGGNLEKDLLEANNWYRKSVFECDDPVAHLGLGRAYYNGTGGIERDLTKALIHFTKAFLNEVPESGIYLGMMSYYGLATEKNIEKAKSYFQFSAEQDFCLAHIYIAQIEFKSGHFLKAIRAMFRAKSLISRLSRNNPNDPRLMGVTNR